MDNNYGEKVKLFLKDSISLLSERFNSQGYTYFNCNGFNDLMELSLEKKYDLRLGDRFIIRLIYEVFNHNTGFHCNIACSKFL